MTVRRLVRFRPRRDDKVSSTGLRKLLTQGALRMLDLVSISIVILLVAAPFAWKKKRADDIIDAWTQPKMNDVGRLETDWMTVPVIPDFKGGDEPVVRSFLQAQPLVVAIKRRTGDGPVWVRKGEALVPAGDTPVDQALASWFPKALNARCYLWHPEGPLPDEQRSGPKLVLTGDPWLVAKVWREGTPQVEQFLRNHFGTAPTFRVALLKDGDDGRKDLKPQPWGAEPNIQADPYRGTNAPFASQLVSNEFPGWVFTVIPLRADARAVVRNVRIQFYLASAAALAVGGSIVLALWLRSRARRKAALDADRMASMTHSLKTPLAILKFRCDTLRLGRHSPDQLDAHLIQIGEEADRLSSIIESALMAIQGSPEVTPDWIQGLGEDFMPAFEAAGRRFVISCVDTTGKAALPSLRAALSTLVENALFHGEGEVVLETSRKAKRLLIRVSDEGPGLDSADLKSLGKPFMRIREKDQEGFRKDGQGLGLSLLIKMVEREGWGLTFESEFGRGLTATIEVPAI